MIIVKLQISVPITCLVANAVLVPNKVDFGQAFSLM